MPAAPVSFSILTGTSVLPSGFTAQHLRNLQFSTSANFIGAPVRTCLCSRNVSVPLQVGLISLVNATYESIEQETAPIRTRCWNRNRVCCVSFHSVHPMARRTAGINHHIHLVSLPNAGERGMRRDAYRSRINVENHRGIFSDRASFLRTLAFSFVAFQVGDPKREMNLE